MAPIANPNPNANANPSPNQSWAKKGHGSFSKIVDQKDFFPVCKESDKVIVLQPSPVILSLTLTLTLTPTLTR